MNWKALFFVLLIGCSQADKNAGMGDVRKSQDAAITEFEQGNKLLDDGRPEEAARVFDSLLTKYPVSQIDILVMFNSGIAHLQARHCDAAIERFRQVVRKTKGNASAFRPRALVRLGDAYICAGDDTKAIVTLIEAYKNRATLNAEVAQAEIPARLAAAYARLGNGKEAQKYFKAAEQGVRAIGASLAAEDRRRKVLSQTLYLMGNVSHLVPQKMSQEDYFSTIRALQKYLLKAVEYDDGNWSQLASKQLLTAYDSAWAYIEGDAAAVPQEPVSDPELANRQIQLTKLHAAQMALDTLEALRDVHIPDPDEPKPLSQLMGALKTQELKFRNYLASNLVGTSLTPEALRAQSTKKMGKVYNPDPILEEMAAKKLKKQKVKTKSP